MYILYISTWSILCHPDMHTKYLKLHALAIVSLSEGECDTQCTAICTNTFLNCKQATLIFLCSQTDFAQILDRTTPWFLCTQFFFRMQRTLWLWAFIFLLICVCQICNVVSALLKYFLIIWNITKYIHRWIKNLHVHAHYKDELQRFSIFIRE